MAGGEGEYPLLNLSICGIVEFVELPFVSLIQVTRGNLLVCLSRAAEAMR